MQFGRLADRAVPERKDAPGQRDESLLMNWSFYADGVIASRTDQGGQSASYHNDENNNLTSATDAAGLTDSGRRRSARPPPTSGSTRSPRCDNGLQTR